MKERSWKCSNLTTTLSRFTFLAMKFQRKLPTSFHLGVAPDNLSLRSWVHGFFHMSRMPQCQMDRSCFHRCANEFHRENLDHRRSKRSAAQVERSCSFTSSTLDMTRSGLTAQCQRKGWWAGFRGDLSLLLSCPRAGQWGWYQWGLASASKSTRSTLICTQRQSVYFL